LIEVAKGLGVPPKRFVIEAIGFVAFHGLSTSNDS
jgi:hypothetical protein